MFKVSFLQCANFLIQAAAISFPYNASLCTEAGNLTHAKSRNTKVAIRSAVDLNAIFNTRKPVIFQCSGL